MTLCMIDSKGVSNHDLAELPDLRKRTDGFLWLDIPEWTSEAEALLANEFHFHPRAISESQDRNHIPRVHVYPHHVFLVLHAPELGSGGHVHYLELDQFVGKDFLVTVHGPINPKVPLESALRETNAVAARLESGRLHPSSPFSLSYAIVSAIARGKSELVADIAREVGLLEQRVMAEAEEDPQHFLSELFAARHQLLTIKTMALQGSEIYRRAIKLTTFAPPEGLALMKDALDQYETVAHISDSLSGTYGHQDDHRRRTPRRHRSADAADYIAVFCHGHERHRQRPDALGIARHPAVDHDHHVADLATLGSQAGLVVTRRPVRQIAQLRQVDGPERVGLNAPVRGVP
jgi:magnesium transporter